MLHDVNIIIKRLLHYPVGTKLIGPEMGTLSLTIFITIFMVILHGAKSELYEIKPNANSSCVQQMGCLTLSQFYAQLPVHDSNITLSFLPGNHTLSTSVAISEVEYVKIVAYDYQNVTETDHNTVIVCDALGKIKVSGTTTVYVAGMKFIGCGNNAIDSVSQFTLEHSTFQGTANSATALVLNSVTNAVITRCYFWTNTVGNIFVDPQYSIMFWVGGALHVSGGTLEITNSTFE